MSIRLLGLFVFLSLMLAACLPGPDIEAMIEDGEGVYIANCARCHQEDGGGFEDFPALAGNPVVTLHNTSPLVDTVLNGRGAMPAFRGVFSEDEGAALLTYIRNAWGNSASPVLPKQLR